MKVPRKKFNKGNIELWTNTTRSRIRNYIEFADKLKNDPDKNIRKSKNLCVLCYYGPLAGGSAVTETECAACGKELLFGNTNVDILCDDCAKVHKLCKHCGCRI